MGRLVLGNNKNAAKDFSPSRETIIYVDNPIEVIKEILVPSEPKVVYVDKPVEKIVYVNVPVEIPTVVYQEKVVYVDKPFETIVEKVVYQDKLIPSEPTIVNVPFHITKTVYRVSNAAWIIMAVEASIIITLLTII